MARKKKAGVKATAPKPVRATWSSDRTGCIVTFDQPLRRKNIHQSQWGLVVGGWVRRAIDPHVIQGKRVAFRTVSVGERQDGSHLTYRSGPTAVMGVHGDEVAAFDKFEVNAAIKTPSKK